MASVLAALSAATTSAEGQVGARRYADLPLDDYRATNDLTPEERQLQIARLRGFAPEDRAFVVSHLAAESSEFACHAMPSGFPLEQSDSVVVGQVVGSSVSSLREDTLFGPQIYVWSELRFSIEDVVYTARGGLLAHDDILVLRMGGAMRLPSGGVMELGISGRKMPTPGNQHLFFLRHDASARAFYLVTGYALSPSGVEPLDRHSYESKSGGVGPVAFIALVRRELEARQHQER